MNYPKRSHFQLIIFFLFLFGFSHAQMVTGVWHGKIDKQKIEVKIVQDGDSITGTSYYYESTSHYRRYSIKGYFDSRDNSVVWWDDQVIEDKTKGVSLFQRNKGGLSRADFNCPGGGVMKLDGKLYAGADQQEPEADIHLNKDGTPLFLDEWDYVIENYTVGANDPDIIDSVSLISQTPTVTQKPIETIAEEKTKLAPPPVIKKEDPVKTEVVSVPVVKQEPRIEPIITPPTIEQKFTNRQKIFTKEIPVTGDSIELRFYDNAEVDGDSISLFLNGNLIFEHIRLTEKAYVVRLSVNDMQESNELIMVAENLGSIPPNTSYMVAQVGDKRYDAQLASTENSSAMIKLVKKP